MVVSLITVDAMDERERELALCEVFTVTLVLLVLKETKYATIQRQITIKSQNTKLCCNQLQIKLVCPDYVNMKHHV